MTFLAAPGHGSAARTKDEAGKDPTANLPTSASSANLHDILALDAFYQDLLAKERAQFDRVLRSKCNLTRVQANSKLQKQINSAEEKFEQVQNLEKKLRLAKSSNARLQDELKAAKSQQLAAETKAKQVELENGGLKE